MGGDRYWCSYQRHISITAPHQLGVFGSTPSATYGGPEERIRTMVAWPITLTGLSIMGAVAAPARRPSRETLRTVATFPECSARDCTQPAVAFAFDDNPLEPVSVCDAHGGLYRWEIY